mgnify:CR=1 FL=1
MDVSFLIECFIVYVYDNTIDEYLQVNQVSNDKKTNLVWIDLEMTGLEDNHVIIEVASLVTDSDLNEIATGPVIAIKRSTQEIEDINEWSLEQHTKSGLLKRVRESSTTIDQADSLTVEFLKNWVEEEKFKKEGNYDYLVADYICPTPKTRELFNADYIVWINTIKEGRFDDTNKMFVKPEKFDFRVTTKNAELWALQIVDQIIQYKWDNKKPTAQMLGRWQPFHDGHYTLFKEIIKKTGQVCIQIRDVQGVDDNPFDFETVKKNIEERLNPKYEGRFKIMLVPNITNICYGRGVGYKIEEIVLDEKTQQISATKIREQMRKEGKLK